MNICPNCNKLTGNMILNDGGSRHCEHCKRNFHLCRGKVKYGSPGPVMCPECNDSLTGIIRLPQIFNDM